MANFNIDEESAHKGYLYVDVDDIATIIIRRWGMNDLHIEVCPYKHPEEPAVGELDCRDRDLIAALARYQRKKHA